MTTLKHISVWSAAKFGCAWGLLVYGCAFTALAAFLSPVMAALSKGKIEALLAVAPMCGITIAGAAISGAIGGFLHFAIMGVLANVVLILIGGIDLEFQTEQRAYSEPVPTPKGYRYSAESHTEIRPIENR